MKRHLFQISLLLLCCLFLAACNAGTYTPPGKGVSTVTIAISTGAAAPASQKAAKAAPVLASLRFTISAADMNTITKETALSSAGTGTIEESFDVPNGTGRVFLVEALDNWGAPAYAGSTTVDLSGNTDGQPIEISIVMEQQFFTSSQLINTSWTDIGSAVTRDSNGNFIVVGSTFGDVDGNANADPRHQTADVFVTKFTMTGAKIWSRQFGTPQFEAARGVAVDGSGNIYIVGSTGGNLNGETNANTQLVIPDAFLVKLDSSGNHLWTRLTGSTQADVATAVAVDSVTGNVYITGTTYGSLGSFTNAGSGYSDVFVAKFDSSGNLLALDQRGTPYDDSGEGIAVDVAGNVSVVGTTTGDLDGNTNFSGAPGTTQDFFLIRYTTAVAPLAWASTLQLGTSLDDEAGAVALDSTGNVYIAGSTWGGLGNNTNSNPNGTMPDLFVTKIDSLNATQWTAQLGTFLSEIGQGIAVSNGYVYATGTTNGSLDGNVSSGSTDIFVVKYDTSGNKQWTAQTGTLQADRGSSVIADAFGNVFVAGSVDGGYQLDAALLSFDPTGLLK